LKKAQQELKQLIEFNKYSQWCFAEQWQKLKKYAQERSIRIVGDIPIFVAHHSADVWANQHEFLLDKEGRPTSVTGVPPDYFSEDGQRWGNPLYRWEVMKKNKYE